MKQEVEPQGFRFKESLEFLPWQHVIIFEKPEKPPRVTMPRPSPLLALDAKPKE